MTRDWRAFAFAAGLAGVPTVLIIAFTIATGGTFGQRCERLYPGNARGVEDCVDRLAHGHPLYPDHQR